VTAPNPAAIAASLVEFGAVSTTEKLAKMADFCQKRRAGTVRQHRPALTTNREGPATMAKPIPTPIPEDVKARFWAKVDVRGPDDCWEWQGSRTNKGYGGFSINSHPLKAHRLAWQFANNRDWPAGLEACHSCDNPPCVNPNHIRPGTRRENIRDRVERGRNAGTAAVNAAKTHCLRGHPLSGDNLSIRTRGETRMRHCRICAALHTRRWRARKKGAAQ